ncbi:MAG: glutamate--tRNA ligase [Anaerolineae bacterium]
MTNTVRVRFAPSPTGYLHVGGARTALFNWLFARHHDGTFILRIEDTDRTRYEPEAVQNIMDSLRWLGLEWDEGPEVGGDYGPYFQSQRLDLYQKYAQQLVDSGHAYRCYCSPERLALMREAQRRRGESNLGYDRHCRYLAARERAEYEAQGIVPVVRLKVPLEGQTSFHDVLHGDTTVDNASLDDLVLLKSDGYPTYHLANVVDDHLMEISHIMRADEWLPSVPKHVLLYDAFGWEIPVYAHLPVILAPTGKGKLSKRHGGVAVHEFRREGYLPEAMVNFLALVGWAYDDKTEFFTRQELIERFDLAGVSKSPAAFSYDKLEWMNGAYIRQLGPDDLAERLLPFLTGAGLPADLATVRRIVPLVQERLKKLAKVVEWTDFFFTAEFDYDPQLIIGKKMTAEESLAALRKARQTLAALPDFEEDTLEEALRTLVEELSLKAGQLFGIIRVAATGKKVAPPLFGTLSVLGRERVLERLGDAEEALAGLVSQT